MDDGLIELFISYSHRDEALRQQLDKHLMPLQRQKVISTWHDRKIGAGQEWEKEIDNNLSKAHIILLLISPDFIASDYCYDLELEQALQRHERGEAIVVPVIIEPCDWAWLPFGKLQAFPKDGKAITTWTNQNEAFLDVSKGIRAIAQQLQQQQRKLLSQGNLSSTANDVTNSAEEQYRQKVRELMIDGEISPRRRKVLDHLREVKKLALEEAKQLEDLELEPIRTKKRNLEIFRQFLLEIIADEYPLGDTANLELTAYQEVLEIDSSDADRIKIEMAMAARPSNVIVYASRKLNPQKQIYLIDVKKLPIVLGRNTQEIKVIGSSSLLNFDPNLHVRNDALFLTPDDLFTSQLFYARSPALLPGTWLDQKLNIDNLTILLPINPVLKDYFTSPDLEQQIQLTSVSTSEGPGIRVMLVLNLSGFQDQPTRYQIYQDFSLKAENEIKQTFPTVALWPHVIPDSWKEYFLFVETSKFFGGLAFGIEEPTPGATQINRQSGQESYQYWKCDRFPQILSAIDNEGRFLGLLPLTIPAIQAGYVGTWTVGVDFNPSFTNIYVRKGNGQPEHFKLQTSLLSITSGLKEIQENTYREFFVPDILLPEGSNLPLSSVLTTRGWQETVGVIPEIISQARIYIPRLDVFDFDKEHIKPNIQWQQVQYLRPFLGQLARLIAAKAANEGVHTIDWAISYPSAFFRVEKNDYINSWQNILEDLKKITGQNHKFSERQPIRTENLAFAQFCTDILGKDLIHTTCVNMGNGTSEISIWQENALIHQASVSYARHELFHRILQPNMAFLSDIFGYSPEYANVVCQQLESKKNFNSALDIFLRGNGDKTLTGSYVTNKNNPHNRQFRTLVAFSWGGLYHYLGLVLKNLNQLGQLKRTEDVTTVLIGGSDSRFLHWLSINGRYTADAEINLLLDGILTRASGLRSNADLMTLSPLPQDEVCAGLVVTPDGDRLKGLDQKQEDFPFLGEACVINGQPFVADQRLKLSEDWESITDFRILSFRELELYITHFNAIIADERIEEIEPLCRFDNGDTFVMTDNLRSLLQKAVTHECLSKRGKKANFQLDSPFFIVLRCFIDVLANQWSKSAK